MTQPLQKLRPDQDLQCYFQQPSAVAAISEANGNGFVVSGRWSQQFDWAVLEWNRDNVFEHPAFRNLPDGDLSGLELIYEETRTNCIEFDSDLYPGEWSYLRLWAEGDEEPRFVRLIDYAAPAGGEYAAARAELTLQGSPTSKDHIGVAWLSEQYNYEISDTDSLETAVASLAAAVNTFSNTVAATADGAALTLRAKTAGANWNRVGVYGFTSGARTEAWSPWWTRFGGGASPSTWRVRLDFDRLKDKSGADVPVTNVRKMRWTYAAGWQDGEFQRCDFAVWVTNWTVSGTNLLYRVAGAGSRRIEDNAREIVYSGNWQAGTGNFSGGTIRWTTEPGAAAVCTYRAAGTHTLLLGTRACDTGGNAAVTIDGVSIGLPLNLRVPGEDRLVRIALGEYGAGSHTVRVEARDAGKCVYFDFLELAVPAWDAPQAAPDARVSLATDWDTDHSLCLAPERTARMMEALGFRGRVNHYVGAMWFYELFAKGLKYACGRITFQGAPAFGGSSEVRIGRAGDPDHDTVLSRLHYIGDTAETVAKAYEFEINRGCVSVRAAANGCELTIWSREMGAVGNSVTFSASTSGSGFDAKASSATLAGGEDARWTTDVTAIPRLNRAARDWHRSFFAALRNAGMDAAAAFSMELRHGDDSVEAGIAQRCPAGDPVWLNTPALQTNFSTTSIEFWRDVYLDMAQLMADAGARPYLQFGEVQWWYFRDGRSGMPYYDDYTKREFLARYGRELATVQDENADPALFPNETALLATLIGSFTNAVMEYVRGRHSDCRFEVLYPLDVNDPALNRAVNYPVANWTAEKLECLKTESFGYTYSRDLNRCRTSIVEPARRGFGRLKSAHLVGISDPVAPWQKEVNMAKAEGLESVVLFALDQFCLIGYPAPLPRSGRRAAFQG